VKNHSAKTAPISLTEKKTQKVPMIFTPEIFMTLSSSPWSNRFMVFRYSLTNTEYA